LVDGAGLLGKSGQAEGTEAGLAAAVDDSAQGVVGESALDESALDESHSMSQHSMRQPKGPEWGLG